MTKTLFVPADGYTSVTLAVEGRDGLVIVGQDGFETDDPALVAALDEHQMVRRGSRAKPGKGDS